MGVAPSGYGVAPKLVEPEAPPQPYAYQYGVADDYSNSNFKKEEQQDANGNVAGSYTIALPDGRIRLPPTLLTQSMDLLPRFPMKVLLSTLLSQLKDMDTSLLLRRLPLLLLPLSLDLPQ